MTIHAATPCPLWRRLIALVYDLLIVVALVMVVGLLSQLATHGQLITTDTQTHIAWWYQPLQGLVVAAYFLASWRRGGQTVGMRPWRIRVLAADGSGVTWRQAVLRLIVAALPLLGLGLAPWLGQASALWVIGIAWAACFGIGLFDPQRRALHDIAAGTFVAR
ncbi:RDD family protein [Rhodanobacter sp. 115]|uniref:RDD family protein n=1 Tax=Rhodanobacter sp. FW021-MT20 TaxID=1162282 RepID=UPI000260C612|nr:RDD family protein [Rhodanobacter sp. 115]EIL88903.1 hypothetical protein UU5_16459 [Rhodanobacter sp. 115]